MYNKCCNAPKTPTYAYGCDQCTAQVLRTNGLQDDVCWSYYGPMPDCCCENCLRQMELLWRRRKYVNSCREPCTCVPRCGAPTQFPSPPPCNVPLPSSPSCNIPPPECFESRTGCDIDVKFCGNHCVTPCGRMVPCVLPNRCCCNCRRNECGTQLISRETKSCGSLKLSCVTETTTSTSTENLPRKNAKKEIEKKTSNEMKIPEKEPRKDFVGSTCSYKGVLKSKCLEKRTVNEGRHVEFVPCSPSNSGVINCCCEDNSTKNLYNDFNQSNTVKDMQFTGSTPTTASSLSDRENSHEEETYAMPDYSSIKKKLLSKENVHDDSTGMRKRIKKKPETVVNNNNSNNNKPKNPDKDNKGNGCSTGRATSLLSDQEDGGEPVIKKTTCFSVNKPNNGKAEVSTKGCICCFTQNRNRTTPNIRCYATTTPSNENLCCCDKNNNKKAMNYLQNSAINKYTGSTNLDERTQKVPVQNQYKVSVQDQYTYKTMPRVPVQDQCTCSVENQYMPTAEDQCMSFMESTYMPPLQNQYKESAENHSKVPIHNQNKNAVPGQTEKCVKPPAENRLCTKREGCLLHNKRPKKGKKNSDKEDEKTDELRAGDSYCFKNQFSNAINSKDQIRSPSSKPTVRISDEAQAGDFDNCKGCNGNPTEEDKSRTSCSLVLSCDTISFDDNFDL